MDLSPHTSNFINANTIRLHYLDWGGNGPVLLFLAGMGCSAHIFDRFAPRFTDQFHVLALDRRGHGDSDYPETGYDPDTLTEDLRQFLDALRIEQVILVGHSMGYIELCHFAALYPTRVLKLIFLDAAYDNTSPDYQAAMEQNPLRSIIPPWPDESFASVETYIDTVKRIFPALAMIWDEVMEEQITHTLETTPDGCVTDKMSDAIAQAIQEIFTNYVPEFSRIQAPVLSIFALRDGSDYLSSDYMTEKQKAEVMEYFKTVLSPYNRRAIEHFRSTVPHATIVEIPHGHHYCFIKHEEISFNAMREFLL